MKYKILSLSYIIIIIIFRIIINNNINDCKIDEFDYNILTSITVTILAINILIIILCYDDKFNIIIKVISSIFIVFISIIHFYIQCLSDNKIYKCTNNIIFFNILLILPFIVYTIIIIFTIYFYISIICIKIENEEELNGIEIIDDGPPIIYASGNIS